MGHRPCISKGEDWIGWDIVLAFTKGGGLDSQDRKIVLAYTKGGGLDCQDRTSSLHIQRGRFG